MSSQLASKSESESTVAPSMMCVPLAVFRIHQARNVDIYIWPEGDQEPTLYCGADMPLTEQDLERLSARGLRFVYLSRSAFADLTDELRLSLGDVLADGGIPAEQRLAVLQSAMALEVDSAFHAVSCDRFVNVSHQIARQINTLLTENEVIPRALFQILRHDFYTFTHLTNVASFATLLADQYGIKDPKQQHQITVAGLLHDLGKKYIPSTVLCKIGRLTDDEWDLIRAHPQRGYEDLCHRGDLNFGQLMMVYSHHERIDGNGYPAGLVAQEIHPWAKLLAVVDVFDALTGARPYRSAWKVSDALAYLDRNAGTQFDKELVRCWVSAMKQR
jgi:HD-GYP domain-containing protein (c-di-GMP phosphodiesterase class II)